MRKSVMIALGCLALCCCNRHGAPRAAAVQKDSVGIPEGHEWLDTLDINIALTLLNMGMFEDYRKYGIAGFEMPKDTAFRNAHKSDIYPEGATDVEWAVHHVNRIVYTDSFLRVIKRDPSKRICCKVRTAEQRPDTVVNHVVMTFRR